MTFIIEDKIYNTETSEKVIKYRKPYPVELIIGGTIYIKHETILYRTKKGNWFSVKKGDYDTYTAYQETEESVKKLLEQLNAIDVYNKYFEQLEEA